VQTHPTPPQHNTSNKTITNMSNSTVCTSCIRTLRQQTRRHLLQRQPQKTSSLPSIASTTNRAISSSSRTLNNQQQKSPTDQASLIASLRASSNPLAKATTEPYVAYGATEDLFRACAQTCSYTIPAAEEKPPAPAPKNDRGEDVGVGEGWWFAPKSSGGIELPVTFNTWAQVMYLHMYALTARLRKFPAEHVRIWEQNLLDHFFYAAEDRMAMWHGMAARGVRNKYLKDLWVQWRGVLVSYDEGLIKGDAELGAAVWRNVFQAREDVDLADVAAVVSYLRREVARLDRLSDAQLSTGDIKFPSPAPEIKVLGEVKSAMMGRSFTQEDLAGLKTAKAA
jgi:cytochrome b pre-mRNA-processing protein 3